ncbi:MAG: hypothetical protein ABW218_08615 [Casimicrobiaceae bacterium]
MTTRPRFVGTAVVAALAALATASAAVAAPPPAPSVSRIEIDAAVREAREAALEAAATARENAREAAAAARENAREAASAARESALAGAEMARVYAQVDVDALMFEPSLAFVAGEFGGTREIVKNAPYSADAINESIQSLADGNRIVKRRTTQLARDGYGRTRQERKGEHGSAIYIFDPIDGKSYALNGERKVAVRIPRVPLPPAPLSPDAAGPGVEARPGRVVVHKGEGRDDEVRVEVVRIGGDAPSLVAPLAPLPPLMLPTLPRGKGETKKLGTKEFDGVKADGTQTTHTIPAGEIGNEKPLVITSERWFSPEYNIVVYAKQSDPRTGDTIYRLANFKRGEPPADLFKVPADYKAKGERR